MDELKPHKENPLVQEIQIPVTTELKKIGTLRPHKGHKIYEFNYVTKDLGEALFDETDVHFNQDPKKQVKKKKIIANKDCIYFSALNVKNAVKKIRKNFREH